MNANLVEQKNRLHEKNINSHGISSVRKHGRRFIIVLEHQYGCRDVM